MQIDLVDIANVPTAELQQAVNMESGESFRRHVD
jgi:hypothetical protein